MALLSLVAKLGLDKTGFERGISGAESRVDSFASNIKSKLAAAFSVAAAAAYLRHINQVVGRIKDLSEQFNVSTDEVQKIDFAMKQSGMTFEDYARFINRVSEARRKAVIEDGEARRAFEALNISVDDANDPLISNAQIMDRVTKAIRGMNLTAADQVRLADLLGEKFATVANVLAGLEGVQPPQLINQDDIRLIDEANKQLERMKLTLDGLATKALGQVARAFNFVAEAFQAVMIPATKVVLGKGDQVDWKKETDRLEKAMLEFVVPGFEQGLKDQANAMVRGAVEAVVGKPDQPRGKQFGEPAGPAAAKEMGRIGLGQGTALTSADQLGRIGAFSGGGVGSLQGQMKKTADTLVEIRNVLAVRGIVIKDL